MRFLPHLFAQNRSWAEAKVARDPEFFTRLASQQTPGYLWIGCSDSRVPANEIVDLAPGELFVHRNVANLVVHTDLNCLSVIQFAVDVIKVRDIIVCGHYGCGGVKAALESSEHGLIDNWLRHIQDIATAHESELAAIGDDEARVDRLCELNIIHGVTTVGRTTVVRDAWRRGQHLTLHGWIYSIRDGLLRDLDVSVSGPAGPVAPGA
ncbi:MAG: carbonate dehydratase [Vicinamibacterales bacterium]